MSPLAGGVVSRLTCQTGTRVGPNGPNGNAYLLIQLALVFNSLRRSVLYLWALAAPGDMWYYDTPDLLFRGPWRGGNMNECQ